LEADFGVPLIRITLHPIPSLSIVLSLAPLVWDSNGILPSDKAEGQQAVDVLYAHSEQGGTAIGHFSVSSGFTSVYQLTHRLIVI
jgi:hypothetical protein